LLEAPEAPLLAPDREVAPPGVPGAVGEAVPDAPGAVGDAVEEPGRAGFVPYTPVAGGVVIAPGPVPGAHGTAVPLVPVGIGTLAAPVLRAVVFVSPVGVAPGEGVALAVGVAPGDGVEVAPGDGVELVVGAEPMVAVLFAPDEALLAPLAAVVPPDGGVPLDGVAAADPAALPLLAPGTADCDRGPASVAVFTLLFADVVVPVELFAWLVGEVAVLGAVPCIAEAEPTPVTGTHGVVAVGVPAGVVALG